MMDPERIDRMRDPARIDRMLDLLRRYWARQPDMRLGQIIVAANGSSQFHVFHVEDDITEAGLARMVARVESP